MSAAVFGGAVIRTESKKNGFACRRKQRQTELNSGWNVTGLNASGEKRIALNARPSVPARPNARRKNKRNRRVAARRNVKRGSEPRRRSVTTRSDIICI